MSWKDNWNNYVRNNVVTERKKTMTENWNDFVSVDQDGDKKNQIKENWRQYLAEEKRNIAIAYFGGFKPPHKGHLAVVQDYLAMPEASKIYIVFGHSMRRSEDGTLSVTSEDSQKVWELYLNSIGNPANIKLIMANGSPALRAAELAFEPEFKGMRISPGYSPKEPSYGKRFAAMIRGLEKTNGPTLAEPVQIPSNINVPSVSATKLRNAIASKNVKVLKNLIPDNINVEEFLSLFS